MGKKIWFLIFQTFLIPGCQNEVLTFSVNSNKSPESLIEKSISSWNELFAHTDEAYLNYIYSDTCLHCLSIKDEMEEFANNSVIPIYFILFNDEIPIGNDLEKTIGVTTIDQCFIKGTPTLILIENGAVSFNIAGATNILETIDLYKKSNMLLYC